MPPPLLDRLRDVGCDREPFTPGHAGCICRLANEAADEIVALGERVKIKDEEIARMRVYIIELQHAAA